MVLYLIVCVQVKAINSRSEIIEYRNCDNKILYVWLGIMRHHYRRAHAPFVLTPSQKYKLIPMLKEENLRKMVDGGKRDHERFTMPLIAIYRICKATSVR